MCFVYHFLLIYTEDRHVALTAQSAVIATWRVAFRKIWWPEVQPSASGTPKSGQPDARPIMLGAVGSILGAILMRTVF